MDTVDDERMEFIQKYFKVEWPTRWLYHLMLNTSIGEETVVKAIVDFMQIMNAKV